MSKCSTCNTEWPDTLEFWPHANGKRNGARCKKCHSKASAAVRRKNKMATALSNTAWKLRNKEQNAAINKAWRDANLEKNRAADLKWAKDNLCIMRANDNLRKGNKWAL